MAKVQSLRHKSAEQFRSLKQETQNNKMNKETIQQLFVNPNMLVHAVVYTGSQNVGRCLTRLNYQVFVSDNLMGDSISAREFQRSFNDTLPKGYGGPAKLEEFTKVEGTSIYVASYYCTIDSSD